MATIKAVANGDWSNPSTWDSASIPTSSDDVFTDGFDIKVDGDILVSSISNTDGVSDPDGRFYISDCDVPYTITCDVIGGLEIDLLTGVSETEVTINGKVGDGYKTAGVKVYSSGGPSAGSLDLTINGDIYSGTNSSSAYGLLCSSSIDDLNVHINGDVYANGSYGITMESNGTINILGDLKVNASSIGCVGSIAGLIVVDGDIYAGDGVLMIFAALSGKVVLKSGVKCYSSANGTIPISGTVFIEDGAIVEVQVYTVEVGTTTPTGDPPQILTNAPGELSPEPYDVRKGVIYGAKTGTLAVPNPLEVAFGIPTDNTVGQAAISLVQLSGITGEQIAAAFEK